jgi:TRAP-type C4-dicarboxylate transport system permease small subunit
MSRPSPTPSGLAGAFVRFGQRTNYVLERLTALLMAAMVGIVWYGVVDRYYLHTKGAWTEELARYVMIWAVFLAVPCCAYYREHIGLTMILDRFAPRWRLRVATALDLVGIAFFLVLLVYGINMTIMDGPTSYASIFGMRMTIPYASVPVCAALTVFMIVVTMVRDLAGIDEGGSPKVSAL